MASYPPPRYPGIPIFQYVNFISIGLSTAVANTFTAIQTFANVVNFIGGFGLFIYAANVGSYFTSMIQNGINFFFTNSAAGGQIDIITTDSLGGQGVVTINCSAGESYLTVDNLIVNIGAVIPVPSNIINTNAAQPYYLTLVTGYTSGTYPTYANAFITYSPIGTSTLSSNPVLTMLNGGYMRYFSTNNLQYGQIYTDNSYDLVINPNVGATFVLNNSALSPGLGTPTPTSQQGINIRYDSTSGMTTIQNYANTNSTVTHSAFAFYDASTTLNNVLIGQLVRTQPAANDNSTILPTTAWVQNAIAASSTANISVTNTNATVAFNLPMITSSATGSYPVFANAFLTFSPVGNFTAASNPVLTLTNGGYVRVYSADGLQYGQAYLDGLYDYVIEPTVGGGRFNLPSSSVSPALGSPTATTYQGVSIRYNVDATNNMTAFQNYAGTNGTASHIAFQFYDTSTVLNNALIAEIARTEPASNNSSSILATTSFVQAAISNFTSALITVSSTVAATPYNFPIITSSASGNYPVFSNSNLVYYPIGPATLASNSLVQLNAGGYIRQFSSDGTQYGQIYTDSTYNFVINPASGAKFILNNSAISPALGVPTSTSQQGLNFNYNSGTTTIQNFAGTNASATHNVIEFYDASTTLNNLLVASIPRTQPIGTDSSTILATTAFVQSAITARPNIQVTNTTAAVNYNIPLITGSATSTYPVLANGNISYAPIGSATLTSNPVFTLSAGGYLRQYSPDGTQYGQTYVDSTSYDYVINPAAGVRFVLNSDNVSPPIGFVSPTAQQGMMIRTTGVTSLLQNFAGTNSSATHLAFQFFDCSTTLTNTLIAQISRSQPPSNDSSSILATTAFVQSAVAAAGNPLVTATSSSSAFYLPIITGNTTANYPLFVSSNIQVFPSNGSMVTGQIYIGNAASLYLGNTGNTISSQIVQQSVGGIPVLHLYNPFSFTLFTNNAQTWPVAANSFGGISALALGWNSLVPGGGYTDFLNLSQGGQGGFTFSTNSQTQSTFNMGSLTRAAFTINVPASFTSYVQSNSYLRSTDTLSGQYSQFQTIGNFTNIATPSGLQINNAIGATLTGVQSTGQWGLQVLANGSGTGTTDLYNIANTGTGGFNFNTQSTTIAVTNIGILPAVQPTPTNSTKIIPTTNWVQRAIKQGSGMPVTLFYCVWIPAAGILGNFSQLYQNPFFTAINPNYLANQFVITSLGNYRITLPAQTTNFGYMYCTGSMSQIGSNQYYLFYQNVSVSGSDWVIYLNTVAGQGGSSSQNAQFTFRIDGIPGAVIS